MKCEDGRNSNIPAPNPVVKIRAGLAPLLTLAMMASREVVALPPKRSSRGCKALLNALDPLMYCTSPSSATPPPHHGNPERLHFSKLGVLVRKNPMLCCHKRMHSICRQCHASRTQRQQRRIQIIFCLARVDKLLCMNTRAYLCKNRIKASK